MISGVYIITVSKDYKIELSTYDKESLDNEELKLNNVETEFIEKRTETKALEFMMGSDDGVSI
jgi:hypothetical protein